MNPDRDRPPFPRDPRDRDPRELRDPRDPRGDPRDLRDPRDPRLDPRNDPRPDPRDVPGRLGGPYGSHPWDRRTDIERERAERERERERMAAQPDRERDRGPLASPGRMGYAPPRSVLSTSPTSSRPPTVPPPSVKPGSPPPGRQGAPLPSFASLSSRPLGAPSFDGGRERSGSNASSTADKIPPDQRSQSANSQRGDSIGGLGSMGQTSPVKSTVPMPSAAGRGLFGGPPPLGQPAREPTQRSPVHPTTNSPTQSAREPPSKPPNVGGGSNSTSQSARPPYSFSSTYASAYTQPYSSYGGLGGSGGAGGGSFLGGGSGYPFAYSAQERDRREKEREREREQRERELREREARDREQREREVREREAKERELHEREARERERTKEREREERARAEKERERRAYGGETKPFQPPRQSSSTYDIYRPRPNQPPAQPTGAMYPEPKFTRHIEVLNRPEPQPQPYAAPEKVVPSGPPAAAQQPPTPRARNDSNKAQSQRDYQYTPRDKRPRMDAAVEEAAPSNRRAASKKKARKEGEKKAEQRDWSQVTNITKKWPEVSSAPVEAWLKRVSDLTRVVGHEVYGGSEWSLAQTRSTGHDAEGGIVVVRVGGGFLGTRWKVRGEPGWDDAKPTGGDGATVGLGWAPGGQAQRDRRIWGTDVYSDDSDLGLVLVHAGWIRWGGAPTRSDDDIVHVTLRVVPRLVRYTATERNGVVTRAWGNGHDGSSIVVEGVERVKVDKTYSSRLPKRTARKVHMAELARQRAVVMGMAPKPPSLEKQAGVLDEDLNLDEVASEAPVSPTAEFVFLVGQAGFAYTPFALTAYIDQPGDDDSTVRSLWTHDLEFGTGEDAYCLHLSLNDYGAQRLKISTYNPVKREKPELIVDSLDPRLAHWVDRGLAIQLAEGTGVLCGAEIYRWVAREGGKLTAEGDETPIQKEKEPVSEAMDVEDTTGPGKPAEKAASEAQTSGESVKKGSEPAKGDGLPDEAEKQREVEKRNGFDNPRESDEADKLDSAKQPEADAPAVAPVPAPTDSKKAEDDPAGDTPAAEPTEKADEVNSDKEDKAAKLENDKSQPSTEAEKAESAPSVQAEKPKEDEVADKKSKSASPAPKAATPRAEEAEGAEKPSSPKALSPAPPAAEKDKSPRPAVTTEEPKSTEAATSSSEAKKDDEAPTVITAPEATKVEEPAAKATEAPKPSLPAKEPSPKPASPKAAAPAVKQPEQREEKRPSPPKSAPKPAAKPEEEEREEGEISESLPEPSEGEAGEDGELMDVDR